MGRGEAAKELKERKAETPQARDLTIPMPNREFTQMENRGKDFRFSFPWGLNGAEINLNRRGTEKTERFQWGCGDCLMLGQAPDAPSDPPELLLTANEREWTRIATDF